jgi:hypothetical protein
MKLYDDMMKKMMMNNQNRTPGLLNNQNQNLNQNQNTFGGLLGNIYNKAKEKVQDPDFMKSLAIINAGFRGKGLQEAMMDAAKTERLKVGKRKLVRARNTSTGRDVFVTQKEILDNPGVYQPIPAPTMTGETSEQKYVGQTYGKQYENILEGSRRAYENKGIIDSARAVLQSSPDLKTGIDASLRTQAQRVADAFGININVQNVTAAQLLQQSTGDLVLNDLGKFKGAISDGERAFAVQKNPNLGQTKEGILLRLEIMERSGKINQAYAEAASDWVERNGGLSKKDSATGQSWESFTRKFQKENPLMDSNLKERIRKASTPKKDFEESNKGAKTGQKKFRINPKTGEVEEY